MPVNTGRRDFKLLSTSSPENDARTLLESVNIWGKQDIQFRDDRWFIPVPPADLKKSGNLLLLEAESDRPRRIPRSYRIWRNISCDGGIRRNDGSITDRHTGKNRTTAPKPNIIANKNIAPGSRVLHPAGKSAPRRLNIEGIGRCPIYPVVATEEYRDILGDGAEFSDV
jgi:hypothetical protein